MKKPVYNNLFQESHTYFVNNKNKVPSYKAILPIYNTALELVWGHKDKAKLLEKKAKGFVNEAGHNSYLIVIANKNKATLVHELYHLVNFISKGLNFEDGDANEAQAYIMGYLYEEIIKAIK